VLIEASIQDLRRLAILLRYQYGGGVDSSGTKIKKGKQGRGGRDLRSHRFVFLDRRGRGGLGTRGGARGVASRKGEVRVKKQRTRAFFGVPVGNGIHIQEGGGQRATARNC